MKAPSFLLAGLALAAPIAAGAHHGWSTYDETKSVRVTAPLTNLTWGGPHGTAKVVYARENWDVVLAPVSRMESRGAHGGDDRAEADRNADRLSAPRRHSGDADRARPRRRQDGRTALT